MPSSNSKSPMTYQYILHEVADKIATLTFSCPEQRNAIHWAMSSEISAALKEAERDPAVSVVILKGAGPCF